MKYTFVDTIDSGVGQGQYLKNFAEFEEETPWADPLLKLFFRFATVKYHQNESTSALDNISRSLAGVALILLAPVFAVIAIAIKLSMPGKVFYLQTRVGHKGRLFKVIKFRTMVENAETQTGHTLSWEGDPRVTRLGNFLRKSHLDELPQLINVLMGDMCFIGPRPERPEFTKDYEATVRGYNERHIVKPGITGLAQLACKYDATASQKLKFDLMYIAVKDSIMLNTLISLYTVRKMIFFRNKIELLK